MLGQALLVRCAASRLVVEERVLFPAELERAGGLWLISSVRRWRRAQLVRS
jgi:hypothetical protein